MKATVLTIALAVLAILGASAQAPANVQAIDLGLPSGIKWASCNVGATTPEGAATPEGYGDYFAWGRPPLKRTTRGQPTSIPMGMITTINSPSTALMQVMATTASLTIRPSWSRKTMPLP